MSPRPNPFDAYRHAVVSGSSTAIVATARDCRELSAGDALPALVALVSRGELYDRAVERWIERFKAETSADDREVQLARAALVALPGWDSTVAVGADALLQLIEIRGMSFGRDALSAWIDRLG